MYVCMYVTTCMYVCMHVCTYVCMYVCMYVHVCMYMIYLGYRSITKKRYYSIFTNISCQSF